MWFGPGEPLLARRGDLLLAHFLLGHNIGGNTAAATRRILYYRLAADGHAGRWSDTFLDPLTEYPSLRRLAPVEPFSAARATTPGSAPARASTAPPGRQRPEPPGAAS